MTRRKTHGEFLDEVKELYGDKVEILTNYTGNKNKVAVKYSNCGHIDEKAPIKLLNGQLCSKCRAKRISATKVNSLETYQKRLSDNNVNVTVIGEYLGLRHKIKIKNNVCGHEYEAIAGNVVRGSGCPICHGMKDTQLFIQALAKKYPGEYEVLGEYINNRTKILVRHKCGYEWDVIPKDLLKEIRCPKCMYSKGELFIFDFLTSKQYDFQPQYTFEDCKDKTLLKFDFAVFVNGTLKLIEFDGSQHFTNAKNWGKGDRTGILRRDAIKNEYCKNKQIPLLRIPYWWLRTNKITNELEKFLKD